MYKPFIVFLSLTSSTISLASRLQGDDISDQGCFLGCTKMLIWTRNLSPAILSSPSDDKDESDDEREANIEDPHGYESDVDNNSRIVSRKFPIDFKRLENDPKVLDQMIIRFYDLVIVHKVTDVSLFYDLVEDPDTSFEATIKMYYACCNYQFDGQRYKGIRYRTILRKVAKIVQDPFFGFTFFRGLVGER